MPSLRCHSPSSGPPPLSALHTATSTYKMASLFVTSSEHRPASPPYQPPSSRSHPLPDYNNIATLLRR
ncbi:hypothetical protein V2J09_002575 [Rumex salicifolius]